MSARHKFGWVLVIASVLAAAIIQISTGKLAQVHSVHGEKLQPPGDYAVSFEFRIQSSWQYLIPVAGGFGVGLGCVIWPSRKPPRLKRTA